MLTTTPVTTPTSSRRNSVGGLPGPTATTAVDSNNTSPVTEELNAAIENMPRLPPDPRRKVPPQRRNTWTARTKRISESIGSLVQAQLDLDKLKNEALRALPPEEQAKALDVGREMVNYFEGKEPETPAGKELHKQLHQLQPERNLATTRFTQPNNRVVRLAELAEINRMIASGELREATGEKAWRWSTNYAKVGLTIGLLVCFLSLSRTLVAQTIYDTYSSEFPENMTEDWNATMGGNWTMPDPADGDANKMYASLSLALPHFINILGFVYDGATGRGTVASQRGRLAQLAFGCFAYGMAVAFAPSAAAVAGGYVTAQFVHDVVDHNNYWAHQFAVVVKGVFYANVRDFLQFVLPKPNATVGELTAKAVAQDAIVYGTQQFLATTGGGLASGVPGTESAPAIGGDGVAALVNGLVETNDEFTLAAEMAEEYRKAFEKKVQDITSEFWTDMNERKGKFLEQEMRPRYDDRIKLQTAVLVADEFDTLTELGDLAPEELDALEANWLATARQELKKHFVGVVMEFNLANYGQRWKNKEDEFTLWKLADQMFGGIAAARSCAMASVYMLADAVLGKVATGSLVGDALAVGILVAVMVDATYIPGILSVKRYPLDAVPPGRKDWSTLWSTKGFWPCFHQFMGVAGGGDDAERIVNEVLGASDESPNLSESQRSDATPSSENEAQSLKMLVDNLFPPADE